MIVVYLFFLACSLLFYIQYEGAFSFYLFCFAAAAPIVFALISLHVKRRLRVSFDSPTKTVARNTGVTINVTVQNDTIFPIPNCMIKLSCRSLLSGAEDDFSINSPIFPRNKQTLSFKVYCRHYGAMEVSLVKVKLYDFLRLSRFRVSRKNIPVSKCRISVIPDFQPIENPISNYAGFGLESNEYSKDKKGDDPSEIFNLHSYNEGDKLSRVHWKLSAKQDDLIVKDYSLPITNAITIAADLAGCSFSDDALDRTDTLLDTAAAISLHLAENKIVHNLIWTDGSEQGYALERIDSIEACRLAVNRLVNIGGGTSLSLSRVLSGIDDKPYTCAHLIYCAYEVSREKFSEVTSSEYAYKYSVITPHIADGLVGDENVSLFRITAGAQVAAMINDMVI